jgi:hypothetical protein
MRKTKIDLTPKPYRLLKTDIAAKLSSRSEGAISYQLLADTTDDPDLFIAVTANEGGGLWSKEAVSLNKVEDVLSAYDDEPFPTKALRGAVVGRSSNNPPFLCAVLKDLGLIVPAPDKAHQHVRAGDWEVFRGELLALSGETVMYPPPSAPADVLTIVIPGGTVAGKPGTARLEKGRRKKSTPSIVMADFAANVDEDAATERADAPT